MKKILLVTSFDNISQFEYFKYAIISSILRNDHKNIAFLTIVKNEEQKFSVQNFFDKYLNSYESNVIIFEGSSPSHFQDGQIYWLFSPFVSNVSKKYKYIIQIDNDVLVNCNLNNLINKKNKKNIVSGVRIKASESWPAVKGSIYKIGKSNFNLYSNCWINAGVVVLNIKK